MIKRIIGPLYTLWKSICYDFSLEEESSCDKTMTNSFYELLGMGLLVEILGGVATFANNDNFVNNHFMRLWSSKKSPKQNQSQCVGENKRQEC